jgi:GNAT superfamily N-acetyltransferase
MRGKHDMSMLHAADSYQVRRAHERDVSLLQAIELDAARSYAAFAATRFCLDLPARDAGEHRTAREHGLALVAERADIAVGFILVVPTDGSAHIMEFGVRQAEQGRGCGRILMRDAEAWAVEAGFDEMTLTTYRDIPWNAPFYARLGYRVLDVGPDRPELASLMSEEIRMGLFRAPRIAMYKRPLGVLPR